MIKNIWNFSLANITVIALLASVFMLGGAYGFEIIGGFFPCDLCWPQRYAHMAVIIFASFALYVKNTHQIKWLRFKMMTTFAYMISVGYSGYHAGVEQRWWEGPDSCTLQLGDAVKSVTDFFDELKTVAFIRCDDIPWDLFGISMAGYNFLISLTLFIMLCISFRLGSKK